MISVYLKKTIHYLTAADFELFPAQLYIRKVAEQNFLLDTVLSQLYFSSFSFLKVSDGAFRARMDKEMQTWTRKKQMLESRHRIERQQGRQITSKFIEA